MKRLVTNFLGIASAAVLINACQSEKLGQVVSGEVDFTVSTSVPSGLTTYASGDGGATNVDGGAYDQRYILEVYDGETVVYRATNTVGIGEGTNFNVRLLAKKYTFALWSDFVADGSSTDNVYITSDGLDNITINTSGRGAGSDVADAYCHSEVVDLTTSGASASFTLKRPFGKIRLVSTDRPANATGLNESVVTYGSGLKVPSGYNVLSGQALSATMDAGSYTYKPLQETVTVGGTEYADAYILGVDYIFASEEVPAYSFSVKVDSYGSRELTGIPVEKNKLTTVIGNFYTNEGSLEVIVDDNFGGEGTVDLGAVWSGGSESPVIDDAAKTVQVNSADQLAGLAGLVNSGTSFDGYTVTLNSDVDLNNLPWTPIGGKANPFKGTFDGNDNTISNIKVSAESEYAGLFGVINTPAVIKDISIENAEVSGLAQVGALVGSAYTGTVDNCHVKGNIRISGNYKVGGLTGEGYAKITNCSVTGNAGSSVTGIYKETNFEGDNVGGIIGYTGEGNKGLENWAVSSISVSGTRKVGGAVGYLHYGVVLNNVQVSNVTVSSNADESYITANAAKMFVGGVVGEYSASGTLPVISGSIESSTVTGPTAGVRIGGSRGVTYAGRETLLAGILKDEQSSATSMWYGEKAATNIFVDEDNKKIVVTDASGLASLTDYLLDFNEQEHYIWGYEIIVDADLDIIDLRDKEWTPLSVYDYDGFNGNNVTVRNFTAKADAKGNSGLFGSYTHISSSDITPVQNIVVENATIIVEGSTGNVGAVVGTTDFPLKNCVVRNSTVTGGSYTGGVAGYSYGDFINCEVSRTSVTGYRKDAGGIVGFLNETRTITGNKVLDGTSLSIEGDSGERNIGWLIGRWNYPNGDDKNSPSTVIDNYKDETITVEAAIGQEVNA